MSIKAIEFGIANGNLAPHHKTRHSFEPGFSFEYGLAVTYFLNGDSHHFLALLLNLLCQTLDERDFDAAIALADSAFVRRNA